MSCSVKMYCLLRRRADDLLLRFSFVACEPIEAVSTALLPTSDAVCVDSRSAAVLVAVFVLVEAFVVGIVGIIMLAVVVVDLLQYSSSSNCCAVVLTQEFLV